MLPLVHRCLLYAIVRKQEELWKPVPPNRNARQIRIGESMFRGPLQMPTPNLLLCSKSGQTIVCLYGMAVSIQSIFWAWSTTCGRCAWGPNADLTTVSTSKPAAHAAVTVGLLRFDLPQHPCGFDAAFRSGSNLCLCVASFCAHAETTG